ncbi:hypothetical protein PoB_000863800 [Plakobranchus ocellatus]|uniref:Uncharacterized protein n=1 Tax=Plakobranchus ocellatus TaxID=259542 RepID=A0AAV3YIU0_9GAST|nr:hypothetical protein PoB_000863800 [Plakobranchus ocellatus]
MSQSQVISTHRSDLSSDSSINQQAGKLMREAMVSRVHDRLSQIETHRASFRRHLSRAKNSKDGSGLVLSSDFSLRKVTGKGKRRQRVNFALPEASNQREGTGSDVINGPGIVRLSKSSDYGSETDRSNSLGNSPIVVSTRDDPHLAKSHASSKEGEKGDNTSGNGSNNDICEEKEEEIRRMSGFGLFSHLEERAQSAGRRRAAHKLEREKTYPGHKPVSRHTTGLINWATSMSTKSGGTRGSDEGSLDSNPAVNFLMRRVSLIIVLICTADRLARIATLRQNVQFIEGKFKSLLHKQRAAAAAGASAEPFERTTSVASGAATDDFLPSRFTKPGEVGANQGHKVIESRRLILSIISKVDDLDEAKLKDSIC